MMMIPPNRPTITPVTAYSTIMGRLLFFAVPGAAGADVAVAEGVEMGSPVELRAVKVARRKVRVGMYEAARDWLTTVPLVSTNISVGTVHQQKQLRDSPRVQERPVVRVKRIVRIGELVLNDSEGFQVSGPTHRSLPHPTHSALARCLVANTSTGFSKLSM